MYQTLHFGARTVTAMCWAARAWSVAAATTLLVLALRVGPPENPEGAGIERTFQYALLAVTLVGVVAAWRWPVAGGIMLTISAVALGVLATVEYRQQTTLLLCLAFLLPAVLFLVGGRQTVSLRRLTLTTVAVGILLAAGGVSAARVRDYYYGPTHPRSTLRAVPVDIVQWIWSGGVTADSAVVAARLARDSDAVRLLVATTPDLTGATGVAPDPAGPAADQVVRFSLAGLAPATRYYYALEAGGRIDRPRQGQFTTFGAGPRSFRFAFSSCASTGSNGRVYDAIRELDPAFFLVTGDLHYDNISANDPNRYLQAFDAIHAAPAQAALYRGIPLVSMWDDHDFGGNSSDRTAPSRTAARTAYRAYLPHYPLPAGDGDAPIYQAFTVGRVRFIMTDSRSERTPVTEADGPEKSMLGAAQKAWFKQELLAARDRYPLIVWVSSVPWIGAAGAGDAWGGYATERRELADFIAEHTIGGLAILSGDAHMLAIDDGANSDYASNGGAAVPVFQAASLDRRGSTKGGPYSIAPHPGGGQFGLMTVADDGGARITVTWSGRTWSGEEVMTYQFTVSAPTAAAARPAP